MKKASASFFLSIFASAKSLTSNFEKFPGRTTGRVRTALRVIVVLLLALLGASSAVVLGQAVNGNLLGTVTDSSGAVISGAKVTFTEQDQNVSRTATTNDSGFYSFPDVPPGTYRVSVEKQGFRTAVRRDVGLQVSSTVRVDITLNPGPVQETVNVEAAIAPLQTDSAQTGAELGSTQAVELPVNNGRNFQNLINLIPGSTRAETNHSVFFNPQGSRNSELNGTSSLSNNFQIEGVNDNERTGLLQVYVPAIEAIQEVNVLTSNYDAEQGTALGAVANVIYKSGTNDFHGTLYEFYNGSALNSKGWIPFQSTPFQKPHAVYNYWGGNFGGPIRKGKTFFFVNYLRTTNHNAQFQSLSVPTAAERVGDFSDPALTKIFDPLTGDTADCLPGGNSKLCGTGRTQFVASSNPASPIYNAACTPATNGFNAATGNCPNIIPTNRLDPVAQKLAALVFAPNNNLTAAGLAKYSNNFIESTPFFQNNNDVDVKIDHYQGQNDHLSGHLGYEKPVTFQAPAYGLAGGPIGGGFQGTGTDKTYSAAINWDHTFSPSFIVQNRIGLNRYHNVAQQNDYGSNASTAIGIPGVNVGAFESGLTGIQIGTSSGNATISDPMVGYSASLPWVRAETDIDFVSNWNKVIGNHTIKWGGNLIRIRDDLLQEQTFSPRGLWSFSPSQTGLNSATAPKAGFANNFAGFVLGDPNVVGRDLAIVFPAYREWQVFGYVNDKWQVKPKLTLNLGLRWEFYPPGTPHFPGGFSNYDPTTNNLVVAGIGGNPLDIGMQRNYHDFAPRIGLAYQLTSKDVVRAGYGISYEPFVDNTYAYDFPVKQNNAFNSLSGFGPAIENGAPVMYNPAATGPTGFAGGFPAPLVATIPSNGIIPANTPLLINQSYDVINLHYVDPYIQSWNLTYERALPGKFTLDVAYVGNRTVHAPIQYNLNAISNPAEFGAGAAGQPLHGFCVPGTTTCRTASTTLRFAGAGADYNALQVAFNRKVAAGFILTTSYTYGKALGFVEESGENSNGIQYYINFQRNYARTDFDRTHIFVQSFIYDLPFGKGERWLRNGGPLDTAFGGWRLSSVITFMTGTPLNFGCTCATINTPGNSQSPWLTGTITEPKGVDTQPWFNTSVFADPTKLFGKPTFGNVGPYILSGPNFFNIDSSLAKNFRLTERFNLQFRTDWFSATNTPQFSNPNVTFGSATFGDVKSTQTASGTGGARNIYFAARLIF